MVLARLLLAVRPDVKVMANYMLSRVPELRDLFLLVDPFQSNRAVEQNLRPPARRGALAGAGWHAGGVPGR